MSRYRTGGTGVSVIGLLPNLSPRLSDAAIANRTAGRLTYAVPADLIFEGDNIALTAANLPDWTYDDRGQGIWWYDPDTLYGRTGDGRGIGNEAGQHFVITVRATGPDGWAECDLRIQVPLEKDPGTGNTTPEMIGSVENGDFDLGAISATPGDTIVDMATFMDTTLHLPTEWWVYAGDPTHLSGTPTFRMEGSLLKLHWPSVAYSDTPFSALVSGRSADGLWIWQPRPITFTLTATATADPGIPPGWTLPPDPVSNIGGDSGIARPLIDGWGHSRHIDSRMMIR